MYSFQDRHNFVITIIIPQNLYDAISKQWIIISWRALTKWQLLPSKQILTPWWNRLLTLPVAMGYSPEDWDTQADDCFTEGRPMKLPKTSPFTLVLHSGNLSLISINPKNEASILTSLKYYVTTEHQRIDKLPASCHGNVFFSFVCLTFSSLRLAFRSFNRLICCSLLSFCCSGFVMVTGN